jgi:hypothetical protein
MYKNITVEAEHNELILENSYGDKVIIPANKRNWVKQKLSEGCHNCIDSLVETLPVASQYAQDGSVYPDGTKVKVNQDNQIKEYDISSQEYKDLYNSGRLMSYDKTSNTYTATPLKEVTVTAEAPQWLKYKRKYESQYTKDWYIDNNMPKFSRSMGVSADNMHPNNVKEYDSYINDKVVEDIFKSKPTFDEDYSNDRLKTLQGFSQKELELIKNSSYASKIEPSIWSKFEQGLLSVGNIGSPVQFKNPSLSQEEAKKEDNPLNILQPLNIPSKMVQSAYKKDYSFKDALKGKQNNAGIVEDIITDPLNLVGVGLVGKLSKVDKAIDATKAGSKVLNKTDDIGKNLPELSNTIDNQLPELPHEIILDNYTVNLERLNPKNKKQMLSFDDVDLGSDLTLRNNPSRVADQNTILGKNRSIKAVLNKKTGENISLKTWQDTDGKIYYYMSANMPSSKLKAGKAYLELEKHIPKGESILENSSLSYDSFLNILKQTKNPKFETFVKGKVPMNDNAKNNLLKIKGDSYLGSNYFNSEKLANAANKELIELTNKYSLPNPTVVPVTSSSGKIKAYEIQLPNIGLKKLYTILGLTSAGTYLQSQNQNKSEQ